MGCARKNSFRDERADELCHERQHPGARGQRRSMPCIDQACVEGQPQIAYKIQRRSSLARSLAGSLFLPSSPLQPPSFGLSPLVARQIESSGTCFGTRAPRHALSIFHVGGRRTIANCAQRFTSDPVKVARGLPFFSLRLPRPPRNTLLCREREQIRVYENCQ